MNPADPESAHRIVAEYASLLEQHEQDEVRPASIRSLPYAKQTIKSAILTCSETLRQQGQLTEELLEFLEDAYVALADYVDDELLRVMTEYREASRSLAEVATARDKVQTQAWQKVVEMSRLAGEIARTIADDTTALRLEFRESQLTV